MNNGIFTFYFHNYTSRICTMTQRKVSHQRVVHKYLEVKWLLPSVDGPYHFTRGWRIEFKLNLIRLGQQD